MAEVKGRVVAVWCHAEMPRLHRAQTGTCSTGDYPQVCKTACQGCRKGLAFQALCDLQKTENLFYRQVLTHGVRGDTVLSHLSTNKPRFFTRTRNERDTEGKGA